MGGLKMKTKIENEIDFENELENEFRNENETGNENMMEMNSRNELEMNSVEFEVISKTNKEISIEGFVELSNIDDESPLQFYNPTTYQPQWHVPDNPYPENRQYDWHLDYELLCSAFQSDEMFLQYLSDFSTEDKTIIREDYILKINDGE